MNSRRIPLFYFLHHYGLLGYIMGVDKFLYTTVHNYVLKHSVDRCIITIKNRTWSQFKLIRESHVAVLHCFVTKTKLNKKSIKNYNLTI